MSSANAFTWGSLATPIEHQMHAIGVDPHVGIDVLVTSTIILVFALIGGASFRKKEIHMPSGILNFATIVEITIGGIFNYCKSILGEWTKPTFFLTGSLVFFILLNNLIGMVPGFNPPTDQFNLTIVLGLIVFVTTHIIGLKVHGFAYIKQFLGPVWWLAWLMLPIELISHLVRPLSLALRLFGNITGDHKVGAVFFAILPLGLPLPFMGMGLFVSFVQAFVFLLLTLIYFQMAASHDH